jgi:hypothetical protein
MSSRAQGRDFHFPHSSHFSWSVLPPLPLIPMFFKGLGRPRDICGKAHVCGIMSHGAAGGPLCRLLIYSITRESPRRLAQTKALRLCNQQKARAAEIAGELSSGRSGSGDSRSPETLPLLLGQEDAGGEQKGESTNRGAQSGNEMLSILTPDF